MSQQPQSALSTMFDERQAIKDRLNSEYILDEIAVERLKNRFRKALTSPEFTQLQKAAFHHEIACLVGMQGRYGEVSAHMRESEKLGMDTLAVSFSEAHLASMNGYMLEARKIIERVQASVLPGQLNLLRAHQAQLGMVGAFTGDAEFDDGFWGEARRASQILAKIRVKDIELTRRLEAACVYIRARINHPIMAYKLFAREEEGILYRIMVKAPMDELVDLNDRLLDVLMERFDGCLDEELSICVTPWALDDHHTPEEPYRVGIC